MFGIVATLHFGLFQILACVYRRLEVMAAPIMHCPIASQSLTDLWGRRWNRAFRDLTYRYIFRPCLAVLGPSGALLAGFLFSGIAHDAVISLPAGRGYGLPTCYFLVQGIAILAERSQLGRWLGLRRGIRGRLFCLTVALAPLGWLFPTPFVLKVMFPFLQAMGLTR
jgi:alginate O-acetyltransferase complex protein AlgI